MCGILGWVGSEESGVLPAIERGLDYLDHRGPDAHAVRRLQIKDATCVLGHTRLRIIDLTAEADQPMSNEDGTVWCVFNGEIYNYRELRADLERAGHRFHTHSDTEVLVHLYEAERGRPGVMLSRLRGMFAFAIADTVSGEFLAARDRLGIKPMYWARVGQGLIISSEVRALARTGLVDQDPDLEACARYLLWGVVRGPQTILASVKALPPGHFLHWKKGNLCIDPWWAPQVTAAKQSRAEAESRLGDALRDSVRRHVVADRAIGVFLSSGVDSGSIATVAAKEGILEAVTVSFPGSRDDETAMAKDLADKLGASHRCVRVNGKAVAASLGEILTSMDQPTSDGVNSWLVSKAARESGLVVALSGVGGDELFGGYPTFRAIPRLRAISLALRVVPASLRRRAVRAAGDRSPAGRLARMLDASPDYDGAYAAVRGLFAPSAVGLNPPDGLYGRRIPNADRGRSLDRIMLLEMRHYMANQLLRDTDQMSMAHSLEVRVPLLDDRFVETALSIPARIRMQHGKALLAKAGGFEPRAVKRAFALPFGQWLKGPLRETLREGVLSQHLPFASEISRPFRVGLYESFEAGRVHWSRPWAVAVLRLWPGANGLNW